ncbi:hypothetical protein [Catenulispora yoronensis]|uniref:YncE family protein n=1 Tax=Catenulispora yoronensis TaxID=450799 RepID=UPI0031E3F18F
MIGTLPALAGAGALAVSDGEGILYAAIRGTDEIAAVNTATLQEVAIYFTGSGHNPLHLAVVGNDVWFSYGGSGQAGGAGIGVLDPAALTVNTTPEPTFYYAPLLASAHSAPNTLVAGNGAISPSVIESFDVSTGSPVPIAKSNPWGQPSPCSNLNQLAITADGANVVAACGAPYHGSQLALSTMTENATYPTGPYPGSVAVAPGSGAIALGVYGSPAAVDVFSPGNPTPVGTYSFGGFGAYGLAWNQSGSELFAVTTPSTPSSSAPTLNVIDIR